MGTGHLSGTVGGVFSRLEQTQTLLRKPKLISAPPHPFSVSGISTQEMRLGSWAVMEKHNGMKHSQPTALILCAFERLHLSKN